MTDDEKARKALADFLNLGTQLKNTSLSPTQRRFIEQQHGLQEQGKEFTELVQEAIRREVMRKMAHKAWNQNPFEVKPAVNPSELLNKFLDENFDYLEGGLSSEYREILANLLGQAQQHQHKERRREMQADRGQIGPYRIKLLEGLWRIAALGSMGLVRNAHKGDDELDSWTTEHAAYRMIEEVVEAMREEDPKKRKREFEDAMAYMVVVAKKLGVIEDNG